MGSAADAYQKLFGGDPDTAKAIDKAETLISAISGISGYISVIKSILGPLFGSDSDALQDAVKQIITSFQEALNALDTTNLMRSVGDKISDAETEFDNLNEYWFQGKSSTAAIWGDSMQTAVLDKTKQAVKELAGEGYWIRPFFDTLVYSCDWTKVTKQDFTPPLKPGGSQVFDYRVTLPAYLEAITIYLTVQRSLVDNFIELERSFITNLAIALETCYDTIRAGIREIDPPSYEMLHCEDPLHPDSHDVDCVFRTFWLAWREYGAVEVYSGYHIVDQWEVGDPAFVTPFRVFTDDEQRNYDSFRIRHLVRSMARAKQIYRDLGLPGVASFLKTLQKLAGIIEAPAPPVVATDQSGAAKTVTGLIAPGPTGDWSVRELAQRMDGLLLSGGNRLTIIGPDRQVSVRGMFGRIPPVPKQPKPDVLSLRAALAA